MSNLDQRLLTAGGLLGAFLLLLFFAPPGLWLAAISVTIATAAWEWAGLLHLGRSARLLYVMATTLAALALAFLDAAGSAPAYYPALAFWLLLVPLWLRRRWSMASAPLGALVGWLVLLPPFLAMLYLRAESPGLLLAVVGIAIVADSAAYFSGRAFGKRKLAPAISPGKTREGAIGAVVAVAIYGLVLAGGTGHALFSALVAFLVLFLLSVIGDLFESWMKRTAGVKDSGAWLPGHGGVLDRIDSLTAVLPAAASFWIWAT